MRNTMMQLKKELNYQELHPWGALIVFLIMIAFIIMSFVYPPPPDPCLSPKGHRTDKDEINCTLGRIVIR